MKNIGFTRKLCILSVFTSFALALSVVENRIPTLIPVPGIKLGLANIIILSTIVLFGFGSSIAVTIARCILGSLFTGGASALLFSLTGGLASCVMMNLLYKRFKNNLHTATISTLGAITHNMTQLFIASIIVGSDVWAWLPFLLIASLPTGIFVGFCAMFVLKTIGSLKF